MHKNFYRIGKAKRKYREENDGAYTTSEEDSYFNFPFKKLPILQENPKKFITKPLHQVTELDFIPVTQSTGADLITLVSKRLKQKVNKIPYWSSA